jgi:shikimate dehydrogenase
MPVPRSFLSEIVALFGQPVAENPTQHMHERAFEALGLNWRYVTLEVGPARLGDAVRGMRAMNFAGANCTLPHKVAVLEHLDEITPTARKIGAVNTVVRQSDGRLLGENTDGKGFIRSVQEAGFDIRGARAVILGAGGAARAIAVELAVAGAGGVTIVNRTEDRGRALAAQVEERTGVRAAFSPWTGNYSVPPDTQLLVNATSIALFPGVHDRVPVDYGTIHRGMLVCDVIPNPPDTPLLRLARENGAATLDGLGMLVYQGAIAFKMWTGHDAPVEVMRSALEEVFTVGQ